MKVFTTGQVAKICKVAPRTVSKWFSENFLWKKALKFRSLLAVSRQGFKRKVFIQIA